MIALPHLGMILAMSFLLSAGAAGLLARLGRGEKGQHWAELGPVVGFLGGFVAVTGAVPLLEQGPHHQLGEVAIVTAVLAAIAVPVARSPAITAVIGAVVAACGVVWLVSDGTWSIVAMSAWPTAAGFVLAAMFAVWRLGVLGAAGGGSAAIVLLVVACGIAAVAWASAASPFAALAAIFAAAVAGLIAAAPPQRRRPVGPAMIIIGGAMSVVLALALFRGAARPAWGVLLLPFCFVPDWLAARLPGVRRLTRRKGPRLMALGAAAVLPALAAVLLGWIVAHLSEAG